MKYYVKGTWFNCDTEGWRLWEGRDLLCPSCYARTNPDPSVDDLDPPWTADDMADWLKTPEDPALCQHCETAIPIEVIR